MQLRDDEFEGQFEAEFEDEFEDEFQRELEGEFETEMGLGQGGDRLARTTDLVQSPPRFRWSDYWAPPQPDPSVIRLGREVGRRISEWTGFGEAEWEQEGEWEAVAPAPAPATEAIMEHLGHAAAEAATQAEAEAFLGALVPMAANIVPSVAPAVMRSTPQLVKGVANISRPLLRSPATKPLARTIPTIVSQTVQRLGQQASRGQSITPQRAVRTLRQQAGRVLQSAPLCRCALQRSFALDRRFHGARKAVAASRRIPIRL